MLVHTYIICLYIQLLYAPTYWDRGTQSCTRGVVNSRVMFSPLILFKSALVMGSIKENRYQYSIDSIDTQIISFQKSLSQTSHPQISQLFRLSNVEFFRFRQHLPYFPVISILDVN